MTIGNCSEPGCTEEVLCDYHRGRKDERTHIVGRLEDEIEYPDGPDGDACDCDYCQFISELCFALEGNFLEGDKKWPDFDEE